MTQSTPKKRRAFREWRAEFINCLREYGVVSYAAERVGINRTTAYQAKERNEGFAREWDAAIAEATDKLELEARRRAAEGVQRLKFHQGQPIMVPLIGADGAPVFEDATGPTGEPLLNKDGSIRRVPVLVPYVEHEYSDTLLIFLLKNWNKEKYGDRVQLSTKDGKPIMSHTTNIFPNLSDDELFDAFTRAMATIAAPPDGATDGPGAGTGPTAD